ncbi:MAG TPA: helix-turn-helix transcriptional regulator [Gemmatimonadaceae bacterium]|nr:helix-turn-helix transcriptional regulator [Gemmatimonadaceae bacterium]
MQHDSALTVPGVSFMPFSDQLNTYRLRATMTLRELAAASGLDFTYISKLERNKVPPPARESVEALAKALKLNESERIEFLALAGTITTDMERWMVHERPVVREVYRSLSRLSPEEQERRLNELLAQVEREHKKSGDEE